MDLDSNELSFHNTAFKVQEFGFSSSTWKIWCYIFRSWEIIWRISPERFRNLDSSWDFYLNINWKEYFWTKSIKILEFGNKLRISSQHFFINSKFAGCLFCAGFLLLQGACDEREFGREKRCPTLALNYLWFFGSISLADSGFGQVGCTLRLQWRAAGFWARHLGLRVVQAIPCARPYVGAAHTALQCVLVRV